jgi:peroxiredoxin
MRTRQTLNSPPNPIDYLGQMTTNTGESVGFLQANHPVLLVFLRHFGCSFCREAMDDLAKNRSVIESNNKKIVFVHMGTDAMAEDFFRKYKLMPVHHVSDQNTFFYQIFGLVKGTSGQIFGLMNWIRGFQASILEGHGATNPTEGNGMGDGFQMPGVFMVYKNEIKEQFLHKMPYNRPDYVKISECCNN